MKKSVLIPLAGALTIMAACSPKSGSTELFNGNDLSGWTASVDQSEGPADPLKTFYVKDGAIEITGQPFGYLYTDNSYADYDLDVEWAWIGKGTNSGVFMNLEDLDSPFPKCIECNLQAGKAGKIVLINGARAEEVQLEEGAPIPQFSSILQKEAPSENPDGEWNAAHIEVRGGYIKIWINGVFQNECHGSAVEGRIALQSEGGPLKIRKVTLTKPN